MASITETLAGDRRVKIANEEIVRTMAFGDKWSRLLVMARLSLQGSSALGASEELMLGLCSGNAGAYKPATVVASIGELIPNASTAPTYNAGPPAYYSFAQNGVRGVKKVGSTVTYTAQSTANRVPMIAAGTTIPTAHGYVFTRVGTIISCASILNPQLIASVQAGYTATEFLRIAESELALPASVYPNILQSTMGANSLTTSSPIDSAFIYWSNATVPLEISDWIVTKLQ